MEVGKGRKSGDNCNSINSKQKNTLLKKNIHPTLVSLSHSTTYHGHISISLLLSSPLSFLKTALYLLNWLYQDAIDLRWSIYITGCV